MEISIKKKEFRYLKKQFGKNNLYQGDPHLLIIVSENPGLSQNQIAKKLFIKPASLTVMIQRMEYAGLIERKQDGVDLRTIRVYITEKGNTMAIKVKEFLEDMVSSIYGNFTAEELDMYARCLEKIDKNLDKKLKV